jgi:3-isopropylmalate/(R)-2-methylmalate dehydratase small subunit
VAGSFARIFYRNAINIGLPLVVAPDAVEHIEDGAIVAVDVAAGTIVVNQRTFMSRPVPTFIQGLMDGGGLDGFVRERLAQRAGRGHER